MHFRASEAYEDASAGLRFRDAPGDKATSGVRETYLAERSQGSVGSVVWDPLAKRSPSSGRKQKDANRLRQN